MVVSEDAVSIAVVESIHKIHVDKVSVGLSPINIAHSPQSETICITLIDDSCMTD